MLAENYEFSTFLASELTRNLHDEPPMLNHEDILAFLIKSIKEMSERYEISISIKPFF